MRWVAQKMDEQWANMARLSGIYELARLAVTGGAEIERRGRQAQWNCETVAHRELQSWPKQQGKSRLLRLTEKYRSFRSTSH